MVCDFVTPAIENLRVPLAFASQARSSGAIVSPAALSCSQ
jgi:hypothetical protein